MPSLISHDAGLVSVITPASYQAHETLARAVRSLLEQTYPHWEMLIISDEGSDYEQSLLAQGIEDSRLRFFSTGRRHAGPNVARNLGLQQALGELIAPLDADDRFHPLRLARLAPLARRYGMSGANVAVIDDATNRLMGTLWPPSEGLRWLDMEQYAQTNTPMIFVFRRNIIQAGWDEDVELGEDTLFNLRALETVEQVPIYEAVLAEYRVHAASRCHAADAHERAERAYTYCLQQLERGTLGFTTAAGIEVVRAMLTRKRELNRHYARWVEAGECSNFQEFVLRARVTTPSLSSQ
jgi:glycosyltransferase involved in cell wall biosynthesis